MPNRNTAYAEIFVDELARSGLKAVCLAPGSRNTPLVLAFAKNEQIKKYSHLDERSAAFFALGLALASDEPVAIVCSSGTAAANFFPAIIEAHQSRIPLIVLTADRPHELRHSGANQTIDQVKIYGDYALWAVDTALPESNPPAVAIRNLRTMAVRAMATTNGLRKGVVHINMPFRKPLEPIGVDDFVLPDGSELKRNYHLDTVPDISSYPTTEWLKDIVANNKRGVIVGGLRSHQYLNNEIHKLSNAIGYPVITDGASNLRFNTDTETLGGYDSFLPYTKQLDDVNVAIRFGNVPISKALNQYLDRITPKYRIHISSSGVWADDSHRTTDFIQIDEIHACYELMKVSVEPDQVWLDQAQTIEKETWKVIDQQITNGDYFDGAVVYDVVDLIPNESTLFAGNSLSVRHLDQFGKPSAKRIYTYANRGASGIDGNISTALGAGAARPGKTLVAIMGDITFYHDMNGLLAVQRCEIPITIVLLNNNGGGIFHRLPIRDFDPEFTDYFVTPHGLDFSHAAKMYGLEHINVTERDEFRRVFSESVKNGKSTIIEVTTDAQHDNQRRLEIMNAVQARLRAMHL